MNECCNFETKYPINKVPLYASFDAIFYALYFNPQESVTCSLMTGELVLETKNSLSGHIVQKFRECTQMDFPPMLGKIKGRQLDGERVPLWRGTALYLVDDIFNALGTNVRLSFPSRYKFWSKVGSCLILTISALSFLLGFEAVSTLGSILISIALIAGFVFILSKLSISNKHYKPKCNCSNDELVAYIALLNPNDYDANSVAVELINRARWILKNKGTDIKSKNVEQQAASEESEKILKIGKELIEKTIEDKDQTIEKLEKEAAEKDFEMAELRAKSEAQSKTIEDKGQEIVKLEKELKEKESEIAELGAKNEESEKTIEALKTDQDKMTEQNVELEKKLQNIQESIVGGLSGAFESWHGFKLEEIMSKEKPKKPELYFVHIDLVWYKACCKLGEYYRSYSKSQSGPTLPEMVLLVGREIWQQTDFALKKDSGKRDLERFQDSLQIQAINSLRKHEGVGRCEQRRLNPTHALELLDLIEENSCFEMKETRCKIRMNYKGR